MSPSPAPASFVWTGDAVAGVVTAIVVVVIVLAIIVATTIVVLTEQRDKHEERMAQIEAKGDKEKEETL